MNATTYAMSSSSFSSNGTWNQEPYFQAQTFTYGSFPPGVSARDLAPENVRHLVHPHWENFPPPDPRVHTALGSIYLILGVTSAVGNSLVLYIFGKYKSLRSPTNILLMNLAFCDLMLFVTLYPEVLGNVFINNGPWMWGEIACLIHSFTGQLFGFTQMQTLQFIALDRYNVIVYGVKASPLSYGRVAFWLGQVWTVSIFWSVAPFFGFGAFYMDGLLNTCSFDIYSQTPSNVGYILGCFIHAYVIPVLIICFCYTGIVRAVWNHEKQLRIQASKMNVATLRCATPGGSDNGVKAELRIAKVALMNVSLWLFAWTPFAVVALTGVLGDTMLLNPYASSIPVLFAKTSAVYNPIVYALSHPKYQQCLRQEFGLPGPRPASRNASCASSVNGDKVEETSLV